MSDTKNQSEEIVVKEDKAPAKTSAKSNAKAPAKKATKKARKPLSRRCKEIFSELKKVSWPTFPKVVKNTCVVLVVVLFFLIVLGVFDAGLSALLQLVVG